VAPPDEVFWFGFTRLLIPPNGHGGKGVMYGSSHVNWRGYRAQHDVVNEVRDAGVDKRGVLTLRGLLYPPRAGARAGRRASLSNAPPRDIATSNSP